MCYYGDVPELNISSRIIFKRKGEQKLFLTKVKDSLEITGEKIAEILGVNQRTLTDWKREKTKMSYKSAVKLSNLSSISLPKLAYEEKWGVHLKDASVKGGLACVGKDGKLKIDEEKRQRKWREWWNKKGKFEHHPIINKPTPIKIPKFSEELAEFVGVVLGDGGISRNQIVVTLHKTDDAKYGIFVAKLIKNLFKVPVVINPREDQDATSYIISRVRLVRFCTKRLGLKIGDKVRQQVDVPYWIKRNKKYSIACVRGLVDTDGCLVIHKYKISGKMYKYKKLAFTSMSIPLVDFVHNTLNDNGIKSRIYKNKDVWVDSKKGTETYMGIFNSHNPKHLRRYKK
jgi:transcriptional regulator with XRE-family HTH domain